MVGVSLQIYKFLWTSFSFQLRLVTSATSYAGLMANAVRSMEMCCDYARSAVRVGFRQILSESLGFMAYQNVFFAASFINFSDWQKWRNGEYKVSAFLLENCPIICSIISI